MKEGTIYFLQRADGLIKIGYTKNFARRVSELTKSHGLLTLLKSVYGDRQRERHLHSLFVGLNEYGEWFRPEKALLDHIKDIQPGSRVAVTTDELEREWLIGERAMADECRGILKRLIQARRQRTGLKDAPAMVALCDEYKLKRWTMQHLFDSRAASVTAFTAKRLRECLVAELEAYRGELLADIAREEAIDQLEAAKAQAKRIVR